MLSGIRPTNTYSEPSSKMGFSSVGVQKSSKQQQNSKIVKDVVLPTQVKQSIKHQDKLKAKSCTIKPYDDPPRELTQHSNSRTLVQQKTSGNCQQLSVMVRATKDDELIKYMSNLPCYLQRVEKTENIQDKALNVGVLDWSRLENWKCNQKDTLVEAGNNASLPSSNLSTKMMTRSSTFYSQARNETSAYQSKQHPSLSCRNNSSHNDGISQDANSSVRDAIHFQDVANAAKRHFDGHKRALWNKKSFDRNSSDTAFEKGRRRELHDRIASKVQNGSSNSRYNGMPFGPKESDREAKQMVEEMQEMHTKRKSFKHKKIPNRGASSSKLRYYDTSPSAKEKKNVDDSRTEKRMELQESAIDFPAQHQADEKKRIIHFFTKKFSHNSFQEQPRTSLDENVSEAYQNTLSDGFSDEVFSSELQYDIPHSCPLPSRAEINIDQQEMAPGVINTRHAELSSNASNNVKSSNGNLVETLKISDQDTSELAARKGRHPSPNRRFSFSLGQMTRSFSFKESSAVPRLSSTYVSVKSGPVISKASAGLDNSSREKASCHRGRSSPLRRLLDPLLKSRILTPTGSAETDQPLRGSLNSYSFKPINTTESLRTEKHEASTIQAHLLITKRNGLPLFRFVINNNNIIIGAPVKNLMSPGKNDSGCNYAFYAIDEIKKKSGSWINQGIKEKSCGFVYNVVGQMKINSSSLDFSGQNSNTQCMVKESVLFGVELRQTGQVSPKLVQNTELAAIVVKMPGGNLGFDKRQTDKEENIIEKGFSWHLLDNENSNSCTVILPGGVHSLPNTGVPSPLIHRWRSGGSCDCGGWDVGCKLRILSSEIEHHKLPRTSNACLTSNRFELFVQGEAQLDKPIFSLAPIEKGKYSVEFSPSISLLQAFFICVTVISCRISSDLAELSNVTEEKVLQDSENLNDVMKKIRTTVLGKVPLKYTPSPPVSPAGRV
ncbi:hypothetical protein P3X46_008852 [Hevea brasiliensis]|uniref:DUF3527 domain-containing protein n=1 Tax=Hevea brasiliensis TaxID=3981 RepID=A0ABQ9MNI2_HEVBR|nr:uncharacterized protein LOC110642359 [Hevea brasiliensis]XP_021650061.2 uncharacterized protein LOC110642359 [Hevea brasiliensis]XP_021650062.2 uncharacterized protein LOC110642359 [Hevea brasiliensis]XP_058003054.1 uncharacterized protein LOC110642359 [Hevea brasiliensis]KAJ9180636.1 hypothetical protein P3X46_008852 [Hevea brasiliensis]